MVSANSKILFLELALAARKLDKRNSKKAMVIGEIEQELKVAERLLDNLATKRQTSGSILVRLNKKIAQLKSVIATMKEY